MTTHVPRWVWLALACLPLRAQAYSPLPGVEGFYTRLLHPFSTPTLLLSLLDLGLMAGRFPHPKLPLDRGRVPADHAGRTGAGKRHLRHPLATAIAAAGLAALLPGRLMPLAIVLAALGGVLTGMASVTEAGPARDRVITMSGSYLGANFGLLYCAGLLSCLSERYWAPWIGIAARITGMDRRHRC